MLAPPRYATMQLWTTTTDSPTQVWRSPTVVASPDSTQHKGSAGGHVCLFSPLALLLRWRWEALRQSVLQQRAVLLRQRAVAAAAGVCGWCCCCKGGRRGGGGGEAHFPGPTLESLPSLLRSALPVALSWPCPLPLPLAYVPAPPHAVSAWRQRWGSAEGARRGEAGCAGPML